MQRLALLQRLQARKFLAAGSQRRPDRMTDGRAFPDVDTRPLRASGPGCIDRHVDVVLARNRDRADELACHWRDNLAAPGRPGTVVTVDVEPSVAHGLSHAAPPLRSRDLYRLGGLMIQSTEALAPLSLTTQWFEELRYSMQSPRSSACSSSSRSRRTDPSSTSSSSWESPWL